jgi:hypothetical protein
MFVFACCAIKIDTMSRCDQLLVAGQSQPSTSRMSILVTVGAGYIGSHMIHDLANAGCQQEIRGYYASCAEGSVFVDLREAKALSKA